MLVFLAGASGALKGCVLLSRVGNMVLVDIYFFFFIVIGMHYTAYGCDDVLISGNSNCEVLVRRIVFTWHLKLKGLW